MEEKKKDLVSNKLIIIFEGQIELFLIIEGTEFSLEKLPAGSILNPQMIVAARKYSTNARFTMDTTFYYLTYTKLIDVVKQNPEEFKKQKGKKKAKKRRDLNPVDYITGSIIY